MSFDNLLRCSSGQSRVGFFLKKDRVLKTVKGILNKEKFHLLKAQLIDSGITMADILKAVMSLIFDKAVLEPTFCPMYMLSCVQISMPSSLGFHLMILEEKISEK